MDTLMDTVLSVRTDAVAARLKAATDRRAQIAARYEKGATFGDIGREFGISKSRVGEILNQYGRDLARAAAAAAHPDSIESLTDVRAYHCLMNANISTKAQLRRLIARTPGGLFSLEIKNCGAVTRQRIADWLREPGRKGA